MSLPPFLVAELRLVFKICARRSYAGQYRQFNTSQKLWKRQDSARQYDSAKTNKSFAPSQQNHETSTVQKASDSARVSTESSSKELVLPETGRRSIGARRTVDVPLKVLPKADITPNVRLSPQERLHIEVLTRRGPRTRETKAYKEKLLIYDQGHGRERIVIFTRFFSILIACATTAVIVPANYTAGSPPWLCITLFIAGFIPLTLHHTLTKSWVSRVFLHLPPPARVSPKAAMNYAHNLPQNATLDIQFLRLVPTPGKVTACLSDLEPATGKFRPATFRWKNHRVDPGTWWKPNPVEFFVKPKSSPGKAARFTVPGIWGAVYKQLTGVESDNVSKWKR